mgnify:FL=1
MDGYTDVPVVTAADFEPTPIYDKVKQEVEKDTNEKKGK